jgi:uncharacterized membrane protein YedE/YeeE
VALASMLDRVPVDEINTRARETHFWRTVLTVVAGLLFGLGWVAAKACAVVWLACTWSAAAVAIGWREARRRPGD